MASESINVKVTGELREYVARQIGPGGEYESTSEFVRDLIRRHKQDADDEMTWLKTHLAPLVETPDSEFVKASAGEIVRRARKRYLKSGKGRA